MLFFKDARGRLLPAGVHSIEAVVCSQFLQKVMQCSSFPILVGNSFISL